MRLQASDTKTLHNIDCPLSSPVVPPTAIPKKACWKDIQVILGLSLGVVMGLFLSQIWLSFRNQRKGKTMFSSPALTRGNVSKRSQKQLSVIISPNKAPRHHAFKTKGNQYGSRDGRGTSERQGSHVRVPPTVTHSKSFRPSQPRAAHPGPSTASTN